jgi:hypothetical protein
VYRFRWSVLIVSILPLGAAVWLISHGVTFQAPSAPPTTESGKALALIEAELPARPTSFSLIFSHPTLRATDPEFETEVGRALAALRRDPRVTRVLTGYDSSPRDPSSFSRDGHRTRVAVELAGPPSESTSIGFPASPATTIPPSARWRVPTSSMSCRRARSP